METETGDRSTGRTVCVINVDRDEVLKKLKDLKAKMRSKRISKSVTFEIEPVAGPRALGLGSEYDTWMRINSDGDKTILTLRHIPALRRLPREHTIAVHDFFTAVKIARMILHGVNYSYLEIERESYGVDNCTITLVQRPYMNCELEISAHSKKHALEFFRSFGIKGDISPAFNVPESVYYKLRGLDFDMIRRQYNKKLEKLLPE